MKINYDNKIFLQKFKNFDYLDIETSKKVRKNFIK